MSITNRNLSVLAAVALSLTAINVLIHVTSRASRPSFREGAPLIQGLAPQKVGRIVVASEDEKTTLARREGGFVVEELSGYPASMTEVNDLLVELLDITCDEKVTETPENHAELGVAEDSAGATSVSLFGEDDERLLAVIKNSAAGRPGSYVRLLGEDAVFLTDDYISIASRPVDFIEREPFSEVPGSGVRSVEVSVGDASFALRRGEEDGVRLVDVPEGRVARQSECERVFNAWQDLRVVGVQRAGQGDGELTWDGVYLLKLDGPLAYTIVTAEDGEGFRARLSARGPGVSEVEVRPGEGDEELKEKESVLLAEEQAQQFNARHAGWEYEISSWTARNLRKPLGELLEEPPAEVEEEPTAEPDPQVEGPEAATESPPGEPPADIDARGPEQ